MSYTAVRAEGLGKRYRIGAAAERHDSLGEALVAGVKAPLRNWRRLRRLNTFDDQGDIDEPDTIWALRDVSFDVREGEVVGIIGRNGAGKSTLLKVLSRITEPTRGRLELRGRTGALLEVGTGFHPELTGRENVYLNGSVLGMDRSTIDRRFDEIVEFSGVRRFIDTPVKRYSSGMYLRLAFSVAAHLEPEILVVDEVLAVGDSEFQRKCLGKMGEVAQQGRTVLFVSHQMQAVQNLCTRAILLAGGRVVADGDVESITRRYLDAGPGEPAVDLSTRTDRRGSGRVRFRSLEFRDGSGTPMQAFPAGSDAVIRLELADDGTPARDVRVDIGVDDHMGQRVGHLSTETTGTAPLVVEGRRWVEVRIPRIPLVPGRYPLTLFCTTHGDVADWVQSAGSLDVEAGDFYGTGKLIPQAQGHLLLDHSFRVVER